MAALNTDAVRRAAASALSPTHRRALAVALIAGGAAAAKLLAAASRAARREQVALCEDLDACLPKARGARSQGRRVAVDATFFARLRGILATCVPGVLSKESGLLVLHTALLVARTYLTEATTYIEGRTGRAVITLRAPEFFRWLSVFAAVTVPAAVVNAGLKYSQKALQLSFQERLTLRLHGSYCKNRAYYAAAVLQGIKAADQRITDDVEKFAATVTDLYSYTFKPLLDVTLFTRSLSKVMGYRGQFALYGYYLASGFILKSFSPPLASMVAQESALTGAFRTAHQRLASHAEEIAFNDPPSGASEQMILNQHMRRLLRFAGLSSFQRFLQQCLDGYFVKYFASVVALLFYAMPVFLAAPRMRGTQEDRAQTYIRSMRLLTITSKSVGDLVLVYKRFTTLAGHTSRVAELLELVERLGSEDAEHRELFNRTHGNAEGAESKEAGSRTDDSMDGPEGWSALSDPDAMPPIRQCEPPAREHGELISFHNVALNAPDGVPLVRGLSLKVPPGRSCMIMGPNGSGKSSLFRVLAGLWPLQAGRICAPAAQDCFYLAQRPYLVPGTLVDQILYPQPPEAVWRSASPREQVRYIADSDGGTCERQELDETMMARLEECLEAVELGYLKDRKAGWFGPQNWSDTLSGGERQRLAMARLLFHHPKYAILDECTSAVSADGELTLYKALVRAQITLLSIAHRPALRQFHQVIIHFDGSQQGRGWRLEQL